MDRGDLVRLGRGRDQTDRFFARPLDGDGRPAFRDPAGTMSPIIQARG